MENVGDDFDSTLMAKYTERRDNLDCEPLYFYFRPCTKGISRRMRVKIVSDINKGTFL